MITALTEGPLPTDDTFSTAHMTAEDATSQDIASLGLGDIARMTRDEMLHLIRTSQLSNFKRNMPDRLQFLDTPTLKKLAYLAHRCCCNRQA